MTPDGFQLLPWDSAFFGFPVARVSARAVGGLTTSKYAKLAKRSADYG